MFSDVLKDLFGAQNHISLWQEMARAVLLFFYGLLLLRLSGRRTFGQWSALDIIVSVIVGSALGRAMTGSAPLPGTMAAAAAMVGLHVGLAHAVARSKTISAWLEGTPVILAAHGRIDQRARLKHMISENDLNAALREKGVDGETAMENVKLVKLETNGGISVVKHWPCKPDMS